MLAILLTGSILINAGSSYASGNRISEEAQYESQSIVDSKPEGIPEYSDDDYILLNDGIPNFNQWDIENIEGEHFSDLDSLGRCGTAYAMLEHAMMPKEERGAIGEIKPSGWIQRKYEGIVDYFLFDTKCPTVGGSGQQFDWSVLDSYEGETPFLLGGGIGPDDAARVSSFRHPKCVGIDLNSKFESSPAYKDVTTLSRFLNEINK